MNLYIYTKSKFSGNVIFSVCIDTLATIESIKKEIFEKVHISVDDPEYMHVHWQKFRNLTGDVSFKCDIRKTNDYFREKFDYFCVKYCKWNVGV